MWGEVRHNPTPCQRMSRQKEPMAQRKKNARVFSLTPRLLKQTQLIRGQDSRALRLTTSKIKESTVLECSPAHDAAAGMMKNIEH